MKRYEWVILIKTLLLAVVMFGMLFLFEKRFYLFGTLLLPIIIFQIADFFRLHKKAQQEVEEFTEAIKYRDFSRYFNVQHSPAELQPLRQGFNEINSVFKGISKEKETQYQYLQKILELVDTGILSYEIKSGEIVWINESLKRLLQIPFLKTIQSLDKRDHKLCADIVELTPGESKIVSLNRDRDSIKILISATAFKTDGNKYKLIAFQNVDKALDETENKAWQKLLSVMTHEIMNSIAPIASLAETIKNRLQYSRAEINNSNGVADDIEIGITTIKKRSEGLLKFAETYRNLNKITTLNLREIYVRDLFESLYHLMQPTLQQKNIRFEIILKNPDLKINADPSLIEQVLINLLVNAVEAVKEVADAKIIVSANAIEEKNISLRIADNGAGIPAELLDKIFIPFFSTRKNGSGVGLSLCKQIMMLHKGNMKVYSEKTKGTVFTLDFFNEQFKPALI